VACLDEERAAEHDLELKEDDKDDSVDDVVDDDDDAADDWDADDDVDDDDVDDDVDDDDDDDDDVVDDDDDEDVEVNDDTEGARGRLRLFAERGTLWEGLSIAFGEYDTSTCGNICWCKGVATSFRRLDACDLEICAKAYFGRGGAGGGNGGMAPVS